MSTPKKILLALALVLLVAGVFVYRWYTASPPKVDHRQMYLDQEALFVDFQRDPGAWSSYTSFAKGFISQLERIEYDVALEQGLAAGMASIDWSWADPNEYDTPIAIAPFVAGGRESLERYVASDLHEQLTEILALPRLAPPSLVEDGVPSFLTVFDTDNFSIARRIAMAEGARLRHAMLNNDPDAAAGALANIHRINDLVEAQPMLISLLVRIAITSLIDERMHQAFHEGWVTPEIAEALLPFARAWSEEEHTRSSAHLLAEGAAMRFTLQQIYEGSLDSDGLIEVPGTRLLWINHATADEIAESYYNDAAAYLDAGPGTTSAPTAIWENAGVVAEIRHGPLHELLPAIENAGQAVFRARHESGISTLLLAIHAHIGRTGAPPATLDELVDAGLLNELPRNPFTADGTHEYRLDDNARDGYTLRSVGPEGEVFKYTPETDG